MTHKTVSMWKVTRNLILTDVCAIALYWLIPSAKMLMLPLGVLCAIGYMLWLGRCFLNDCKANLPNEDYQRIAAEFGFIWFWNPGRERTVAVHRRGKRRDRCGAAAHLAREYGACHRVAGGHGGTGLDGVNV